MAARTTRQDSGKGSRFRGGCLGSVRSFAHSRMGCSGASHAWEFVFLQGRAMTAASESSCGRKHLDKTFLDPASTNRDYFSELELQPYFKPTQNRLP